MNKKKKFFGVLIFLAVFAVAIAIVMLLWNALIPSIIGWTAVNYWQAAGLMLLCRLLLGGFGRFGNFGRFGHHHHGHHKRKMEEMIAFREKMKDMSRDERREYIRGRMRPDFFEREDNAEPKE
ncbi:MAG: hypothetical protein LBL79_15675 [Prevotella sp.]|jgi:hypothetical protein|nr:hypothetical protein [Prevotella sp.]